VFLCTEDGMGRIDAPRFPLLRNWTSVIEALGSLYAEDHDYGTAVLDSLDWLEPIIWDETCRRNGIANVEAPGYGKGYVLADVVWREFFDAMLALREAKGMAVILIAHTEIKQFNDPNTDPYDRYRVKLQTRAAGLAEEWADCVLFANFRVYTTATKTGFEKKVTRGVGSGERVLYTEERPGFRAKNRYSLPPELPFTWSAFTDALSGKQPAATPAAA
jgi:hypothetical protein